MLENDALAEAYCLDDRLIPPSVEGHTAQYTRCNQ